MIQLKRKKVHSSSKSTYNLGNIFPACWTSSYRSTMETPCLLSSLKNISSLLSSSNALISMIWNSNRIEPYLWYVTWTINWVCTHNKGRGIYTVHNICEARASKFEAPIAFAPSILKRLWDCSRPAKKCDAWIIVEILNWILGLRKTKDLLSEGRDCCYW